MSRWWPFSEPYDFWGAVFVGAVQGSIIGVALGVITVVVAWWFA